jgi:hypothetical protein
MGRRDGVSDLDAVAFARLFRSSCNVCGSSRLIWGSVGDEVGRLQRAGQDPAVWLDEVGQGLGISVGPTLLAFSAWRCGDCDEVGVFGPVEVGP